MLAAHAPESWVGHVAGIDWAAVASAEHSVRLLRERERAAAARLGLEYVHGASRCVEVC